MLYLVFFSHTIEVGKLDESWTSRVFFPCLYFFFWMVVFLAID